MKHFVICILLLVTTGCCKPVKLDPWVTKPDSGSGATLYRFRVERLQETRFSGLLALQKHNEGIEGVLLDATGIQLVKTIVRPDGSNELSYCAAAACDTKLPELVGKIIEYIYFLPANTECPWYAFSCICQADEKTGGFVKWKRWGPFRSWEIQHQEPDRESERIDVRMYFSSVTVHLQRIERKAR